MQVKTYLPVCFILLSVNCFSQTCLTGGTVSAPLTYNNVSNLSISGLRINTSSGNCIRLENCSNITITNCLIGPSGDEGIYIYSSSNITITNCVFLSNSAAVYAQTSQT